MSATATGRRYERLLFFAGPLAFVCVLVLFVALAFDRQQDRVEARCLGLMANHLEANIADLSAVYSGKSVTIREKSINDYWLALSLFAIDVPNISCYKYWRRFVPGDYTEKRKLLDPHSLLDRVKRSAADVENKPLSMYGIEVPDKATISILGTPVQMGLKTFLGVMQVALCPVLLLWLGSLYNTRHRESLYISQMADVRNLYPHLVNAYPVLFNSHGQRLGPRRRGLAGWIHYGVDKYFVPGISAIIRLGLLVMFIGPPTVAYIASLYFASPDPSLLWVLGVVVVFFALMNMLAELLPWHINKRFRIVAPPAT